MRFSDQDIKNGVIKYTTHHSKKWGAVNFVGEEIIPLGDVSISWIKIREKNYFRYFDKQKGKERNYDPLEQRFNDE